jgi:hypothetical protein
VDLQVRNTNQALLPNFSSIGPNSVEDIVAMLATHPLYDDYWEAKRIPVENIADIPLYILASYS